ncbi:hypothetical protein VTK26DRAFT_2484 [Humicola hyalothermophila]
MSQSQPPQQQAPAANQPAPPSYARALARLAQLQSNLAVTSLFDRAKQAPAKNKSGDAATTAAPPPAPPKDLNALAIPEMLDWLRRAGYTPEGLAARGLRCVHVAGTKGKGSVSALVAGVLGQYRDRMREAEREAEGEEREEGKGKAAAAAAAAAVVGLYTSPHVVDVRERIVLDGEPIGEAAFARYVDELWDRFTRAARDELRAAAADGGGARTGTGTTSEDELEGPRTKPFYFRFLTILALHVFAREGVRDAVVECGIGGEYDATNVLPAEAVTAAVVTQLGIDHVGMLGDTVEKIAWHKSGVFKPGVKAFTRRLPDGPRSGGVMAVLRARAREKGATLVEVGNEEVEAWDGVEGARLGGPFQKHNMALAVYAAREHLLRAGIRFEGRFGTDEWTLDDIPPEFVKGLRETTLRGRCEVFTDKDGIEWHLDGAHTEDSLAGVGRWFVGRNQDEHDARILIFNQQERDVVVLLKALMAGAQEGAKVHPVFTHAVFTRNEERKPADGESRDLSAQEKARETMQNISATTVATTETAAEPSLEYVRKLAARAKQDGKACKVLVTGSFHLVGAVLETISSC